MYHLRNSNGVNQKVKQGFCWTMFFFGFFVPLVRGDWKWFLITLVAAIATSGISWFVFPFVYNKIYLNDLLNSGYAIVENVV